MFELVLGGARSGKSRWAETLVARSALAGVYLATARPGDAEMAERIERHRRQRPATWRTVEEPLHLAAALRAEAAPDRCLLVDCLTLWLTNLLLTQDEALFTRERRALLDCLPGLPGRVMLVGNEVGTGVVPLGELSRRFVDENGWLHQDLAAEAGRVWWVVAGLPQCLKGDAGEDRP